MSSKFEILDNPIMAPGKCIGCGVCNGDATRKFIDTRLELDFYGVVYWCTNCFTEVANQLKYISPSQWTDLQEKFDLVFEYNQELVRENESIRASMVSLSQHTCRPTINGRSDLVDEGRKDVPSGKSEVRAVKSPENATPDARKGSPNTVGTKSSSEPSLDVLKL